MAYQKDTVNTLAQAIDKFLSFCCLHGGYTRNPDSGTVKSIKKGDINWNFDSKLKFVNIINLVSNYIECWMSYDTGVSSSQMTSMSTWKFKEPFVAIHMFANQNTCSLVVEISNGVFTELAFGNVKDFTGDLQGGEFLVANGQMDGKNEAAGPYYSCVEYSRRASSFFNTPTLDVDNCPGTSYVRLANTNSPSDFVELGLDKGQYFCGHNNPLTSTLIERSPASNILRHTSPPLYFMRKDQMSNRYYVAGHIEGVRPCTMNLLQPVDVIMDRWMAFPMTSINDNSSMYPSCNMRGYLFDMGD